jgi:hypothetical protein
MAKISHDAQTFHFSELAAGGMRLVDEFQRHHPLMSKATSGVPTFRTFTCSTPEELQLLEELAKSVAAEEE